MSVFNSMSSSLDTTTIMINWDIFYDRIQNFNMDNYLKEKFESENIDRVTKFLEIYKRIEEEDLKKPIFSQTTKFKKFPNHLKYYRYIKFARSDENRKKWSIELPQSENDKIIQLVQRHLNMIAEDNFQVVRQELMSELVKIDNPDLFQILSDALYEKCIQDGKYRHFYVQLSSSIWNKMEIHQNRYELIDLEGDYYVQFKYPTKEYGLTNLNEDNMIGPFSSEGDARMEAYLMMNFKRYFVNYLEEKFRTKNIGFVKENVDDNVFFEKKRQLFGMVDIMLIMFNEKYIHMDIPHIIILHFLHITDNAFDVVEEIELECVHRMIKFFYDNGLIFKNKYPVFDNYLEIFEGIVKCNTVSSRMDFFIREMVSMITNPQVLETNNFNVDKPVMKIYNENDTKENVLKSVQQNNIKILVDTINNIPTEEREIIIEYTLLKILERRNVDDYMGMIMAIQYTDIMERVVSKIIDNFNENSLDIAALDDKLMKIMANMIVSEEVKSEWENKINNIVSSMEDWELSDISFSRN